MRTYRMQSLRFGNFPDSNWRCRSQQHKRSLPEDGGNGILANGTWKEQSCFAANRRGIRFYSPSTAYRHGDKLATGEESTMNRTSAVPPPVVVEVAVNLTAIIRPEPEVGGCSASIPALPGCHTQGETLEEVRANLREAVEAWLAVAHEDGMTRDAAEPHS